MRRPRGPGGRFLTAAEIAEMEKNGTLVHEEATQTEQHNEAGEAQEEEKN